MESIFEIAANVSTPLALGGFFAAILFFIFKRIIEKDIFPALTKSASADVIKLIIDRLFVLALVAMVLRFAGYVFKLSIGKPQVVTDNKSRQKYTFVTSQKLNSDFGGLAKADLICNNLAAKAGLRGDFKAWLSDSHVGPRDRFKISDSTYILPSKKAVIHDFSSFMGCSKSQVCLEAAINENENGMPVPRPRTNRPENRVWTATRPNGSPMGNSCFNWTSIVPSPSQGPNDKVVILGDPTSVSSLWTSSYSANCNELKLGIYCFEQ